MKTIVLDGVEYALVPKEQLQPVNQPPTPAEISQETTQDSPGGILSDFVDSAPVAPIEPPVDDGLATHEEKQELIQVHIPHEEQTIVSQPVAAPKAQPRPYAYRQKFLDRDLSPADVMTFPRISRQIIDANPEDPMIKADSKLRKEDQLFYGPGTQVEGY